MTIERRILPGTEIRAVEIEGRKKLEGYAAMFGMVSGDLGGFREQIAPGAFKRSINDKADVRALWNHDPNFVLGRSQSDTLALSEDDKGLKVTITPPNTQWANDLMVSIERGDVSQMSFGFRVVKDSWQTDDRQNLRTLEEVDLFDVSPVTFPAYPQTSIQTRSILQNAGLDFDAIQRVLIRIEHSLALDEDDRAAIRKAVETLESITPKETLEDKAEDTEEDNEAILRVQLLSKKLKLRDRTLSEDKTDE